LSVPPARYSLRVRHFDNVFVIGSAVIADDVLNAAVLSLSAVQLHGSEDHADVNALREALPRPVQIWKALSGSDALPA
ncbi:bifunctional indole-3-glycerol-phosphate synthase TrpC/phosphoribosylanthranilate isomerase TrpF, partial [Salmonella enterica subsp. enterica serovar Infantis]